MKLPNYDNLQTKKDKDEKIDRVYPALCDFYSSISRTLICGPSGSGKTNLLLHILLTPLIYYESIVLYTKTPDQPKYVEIKKVFDKLAKDNKITSFFEIKSGNVEPVDDLEKKLFKLIIFDDYILEKAQFDHIVKYFVLGRHHKCSVIFLSQSYYQTPKNIRINCSQFHLFSVPGRRETRSILQDHSGITEKQYLDNTQGFDFLSINKVTKKSFRNMDEPLA